MKTKQLFFSAFMAAAFAVIYFPAEKASAQAEDGNHYSTPIEMVVNGETDGEQRRISQNGIMDPIGLRSKDQLAIMLNVPTNWADSFVGLALLDGGALGGAENLQVKGDGTAGFSFMSGDTPGLYRVLLIIGSEQYQLQFYVPNEMDVICQ